MVHLSSIVKTLLCFGFVWPRTLASLNIFDIYLQRMGSFNPEKFDRSVFFCLFSYLLIMPTFLRVYSNIQSNPMLKKAIEYCCRQFFILHRIPFILQMLGSISQLLDFDEQSDVTDTNKIQPINLFRLLIALEQTSVDAMRDDYSILELVKDDTPTNKTSIITPSTMPVANLTVVAALGQGNMIAPATIKTLDFCYADDDTIFTVLNCIDVCVTVGKE